MSTANVTMVGQWSVELDTDEDRDEDNPWLVFDQGGDLYDTYPTREAAVDAATEQANEEECDDLRDEIQVQMDGCDNPDVLRAVLALLNG